MKITLEERHITNSAEGHQLRELVGLATMNITKYSVAHIVAEASSKGSSRQNQFDEILIGISGRGTVQLEYVKHTIGPKELVLLPAGTRYSIDADSAGDLELWAICVPAFRPEWSNTGTAKRDWRDYQVPRGADRLREVRRPDE
jgi:mannose-6-phosphate isomerase-like protein (cupin superfamily)